MIQKRATVKRTATALVLAPVTFALIWVPVLQPLFSVFVALLVGIGLYEYSVIVRACGIDANRTAVIVSGALVVLTAFWFDTVALSGVFTFCLLILALLHLSRHKHTVSGLAASLAGVAYVGWLGAHFVLLHRLPGWGPGLVTLLILAVGLSDAGAYFVGSAMGRHRMAPTVSPKKSWEGAGGGLVFAMVSAVLLQVLNEALERDWFPPWPMYKTLIVGALLSVASQIGDLTESMIKRDAGVKDSGSIFPGHGGVLDRCDGFLFAAPVLYYLTTFWIHTAY